MKTLAWQPGAIYLDTTEVDLPPGDYAMTLGLWRPEDGSRLRIDEAKSEHVVGLGAVMLQ